MAYSKLFQIYRQWGGRFEKEPLLAWDTLFTSLAVNSQRVFMKQSPWPKNSVGTQHKSNHSKSVPWWWECLPTSKAPASAPSPHSWVIFNTPASENSKSMGHLCNRCTAGNLGGADPQDALFSFWCLFSVSFPRVISLFISTLWEPKRNTNLWFIWLVTEGCDPRDGFIGYVTIRGIIAS